MKFLIRNPAPDDEADQVFWGDYHFGKALTRCLQSLGCEVETQFWPNWTRSRAVDVLLVLRGIRPVEALDTECGRSVIWVISHPGDVRDEELTHFDLVLCASVDHAQALRQRGFDARPFLQCTDETVFFPGDRPRSAWSNAFVFVGNARAERYLVHEAVASGLPLKIWGRGWTRAGYDRCVADLSIPNESLGHLYRSSFCTLNDHWSDMADYSYVNNRVFDALACGLPIVSDIHRGLEDLDLGGIWTIASDECFDDAIDEFLINYDQIQEDACRASKVVLQEHTFEARARELLGIVQQ